MILTTYLETSWGTLEVTTEHRPCRRGLGWLLGYIHSGRYGGDPLDRVMHGRRNAALLGYVKRREPYLAVAPGKIGPRRTARQYHAWVVARAQAFAAAYIPGYLPVEVEDSRV